MKKLFVVLSLLCFATITIKAQINVTVMIKRPTPALISDWQRDPLIVNVLTMNKSLESYENAVFSLKIRDESGRVVFQTENFDPLQPRFDFYRGASSNYNGTQIINLNAVKFDDAFKTRITTTNMIPEGDYEFCVEILDENGNSISSNGERCAFFSITIPDPPMLIAPFDENDVQPNSFPQFIWTPVTNIPAGLVLKYHLMVAPVYTGQNRRYALESNQLLLDKIIQTSSYQYLPSDKSFSLFPDAVGFAWQVEALDQWNNPATRNEGKSEIGYFSFAETEQLNSLLNADSTYTFIASVSGRAFYLPVSSQEDDSITINPLPNTELQLLQKYKVVFTNGESESITLSDSDSILATTKTDSDGNFNVSFMTSKEFGTIDSVLNIGGQRGNCVRFGELKVGNIDITTINNIKRIFGRQRGNSADSNMITGSGINFFTQENELIFERDKPIVIDSLGVFAFPESALSDTTVIITPKTPLTLTGQLTLPSIGNIGLSLIGNIDVTTEIDPNSPIKYSAELENINIIDTLETVNFIGELRQKDIKLPGVSFIGNVDTIPGSADELREASFNGELIYWVAPCSCAELFWNTEVKGRLLFNSTIPVANKSIYLYSAEDGNIFDKATTDENGFFCFCFTMECPSMFNFPEGSNLPTRPGEGDFENDTSQVPQVDEVPRPITEPDTLLLMNNPIIGIDKNIVNSDIAKTDTPFQPRTYDNCCIKIDIEISNMKYEYEIKPEIRMEQYCRDAGGKYTIYLPNMYVSIFPLRQNIGGRAANRK